jgi:hypothetical protein
MHGAAVSVPVHGRPVRGRSNQFVGSHLRDTTSRRGVRGRAVRSPGGAATTTAATTARNHRHARLHPRYAGVHVTPGAY